MKRMRIITVAALAAAFTAGTGSAAAQQGPPAPLPLAELSFPDFEERTLSNGADVIVVPQHELPFVSVNLVLRAGSARDPDGLAGLASTTAQLLNKGTQNRAALDIAEAVDFIGATLIGVKGANFPISPISPLIRPMIRPTNSRRCS